mmetsp:Transcript_2393/g.3100  ORF Transcript_2393/g.3100 Transcript_2393/m.3100 type:complete len:123 (+) Transcript_2393:86-454(+)
MEVEKNMALNNEFNIDIIKEKTYDGFLLNSYLSLFNAYPQAINSTTTLNSTTALANNFSYKALMYFKYVQSLITNEVTSAHGESKQSLEELNFDFQITVDPEIQMYEKLNYLALMEFWKEYI